MARCVDSHETMLVRWRWHFEVEFYQSWSLWRARAASSRYFIFISDSMFMEIGCMTSLPQCPYPFVSLLSTKRLGSGSPLHELIGHITFFDSSQFPIQPQLPTIRLGSPANLWMIFPFLNTTKLFLSLLQKKKFSFLCTQNYYKLINCQWYCHVEGWYEEK